MARPLNLFTSQPKSKLSAFLNVDDPAYCNVRFLIHDTSGPFLSAAVGHHMIALSCVLSLSAIFSILHPCITDDEMKKRIVNECYSLYPYAYDFWLQHLVRYGQCQADLTSRQFSVLVEPLQRLLDARRHLERPETKTLDGAGISEHEETLLGTLECEPGIQSLIRAFFGFHKIMKGNEEIKDNVSDELSRLCHHISDYLTA